MILALHELKLEALRRIAVTGVEPRVETSRLMSGLSIESILLQALTSRRTPAMPCGMARFTCSRLAALLVV